MSAPNQAYSNLASSVNDPQVQNRYIDDRIKDAEYILSGGTGFVPIVRTPNTLIKYNTADGAQVDTELYPYTTTVLDDSLKLAAINNPGAQLDIGATATVIDFHNTPVINFSASGPGVSYIADPPIAPIDANGIIIDNTLSVISLQFADSTNPGIISTSTQTIAGTKSLSEIHCPILDAPFAVLAIGSTATKIQFGQVQIERFMDYSQNIEIGQNALLNIRGANTNSIAIGANVLASATIVAAQNVAIGNNAMRSMIDGLNNTALGQDALRFNNMSNSTAVGYWALRASLADGNTACGSLALYQNTTGTLNTALGTTTLAANIDGDACTGVGYGCLASNTSGDNNTGTGAQCLDSNTSGVSNSAFGTNAMSQNLTGNRNCGFGVFSLFNCLVSDNTAFGYNALPNVTTGSSNIGIGSGAGSALVTTSNNICIANIGDVADSGVIRIGTELTHLKNFQAGIRGVTPDLNDGLPVRVSSTGQLTSGSIILSGNVTGNTSATVVTNVGGKNEVEIANAVSAVQNATSLATGNQLVIRSALGDFNGRDILAVNLSATGLINMPTTASPTIGVITQNGNRWIHSIGTNCFFAGQLAGNPTSASGARSTGVGVSALSVALAGADNSAFGYLALALSTGGTNAAFGSSCLAGNTTGVRNTAMGYEALLTSATANDNVAIGYRALRLQTSGGNTVVGSNSAISATGINNTSLGSSTLFNLTTGASNIAIGANAGGGLTTGSNNIYIGVAANSATDSNVCKINSIRGITTASATGIAVLIDANGQLGTVSSTRDKKENIVDLNIIENSNIIRALKPRRFDYKTCHGEFKQFGLIVDEVEQICPDLIAKNSDNQPETIYYNHIPIMNLTEIKRLQLENDELKARISALETIVNKIDDFLDLKLI